MGSLRPIPEPLLAPDVTSLPGLRADGGLLMGRWVAAASLVGQSHLAAGTTAQDAYQYTVSDDGSLLILVVCDGLGSRPRTSQIGAVLMSAMLCRAAAIRTAQALTADPAGVLGDVLADACAQARGACAVLMPGLTDSDLACTAVLCLVPTDPFAGHQGWATRVGDCAVLTLTNGEWGNLFPRDDGPLNQVDASLPHSHPATAAEYAPVPARDTVLVLASDGVAEDAFSSPGVRGWLADLWTVPCDASAMADALRYRRTGSHDDRTALVLWPPAGPEADPGCRRPAEAPA